MHCFSGGGETSAEQKAEESMCEKNKESKNKLYISRKSGRHPCVRPLNNPPGFTIKHLPFELITLLPPLSLNLQVFCSVFNIIFPSVHCYLFISLCLNLNVSPFHLLVSFFICVPILTSVLFLNQLRAIYNHPIHCASAGLKELCVHV